MRRAGFTVSGERDSDDSATFEIWFKLDRLDGRPQTFLETGGPDSHLSLTIGCDRTGDNRAPDAQGGANDILSLVTGGNTLIATDAILGVVGRYSKRAERGLGAGGQDWLLPFDDRHSLTVTLSAAADWDQLRVITAALDSELSRSVTLPGDLNDDDRINSLDLAVVLNGWGRRLTASLPESAMWSVLVLGVLLPCRRKREPSRNCRTLQGLVTTAATSVTDPTPAATG